MAQWVALRPIFEVFEWDQRFKVGGIQRRPRWRKVAPGEVIRKTLEKASWEARLVWGKQDPYGATETAGRRA